MPCPAACRAVQRIRRGSWLPGRLLGRAGQLSAGSRAAGCCLRTFIAALRTERRSLGRYAGLLVGEARREQPGHRSGHTLGRQGPWHRTKKDSLLSEWKAAAGCRLPAQDGHWADRLEIAVASAQQLAGPPMERWHAQLANRQARRVLHDALSALPSRPATSVPRLRTADQPGPGAGAAQHVAAVQQEGGRGGRVGASAGAIGRCADTTGACSPPARPPRERGSIIKMLPCRAQLQACVQRPHGPDARAAVAGAERAARRPGAAQPPRCLPEPPTEQGGKEGLC